MVKDKKITMTVECSKCGEKFNVSAEQVKLVEKTGRGSRDEVEFNCPRCKARNILYSKMVDVRILREIYNK